MPHFLVSSCGNRHSATFARPAPEFVVFYAYSPDWQCGSWLDPGAVQVAPASRGPPPGFLGSSLFSGADQT